VPGTHSLSIRTLWGALLWLAVLPLCLAAAAVSPASAQATPGAVTPGETVRAISFNGLDRATPADLRSHMQTQPGRPFSEELFRADVIALRNAGFFVRY